MSSHPAQGRSGRFQLRWPKSRGLVILIAGAAGLTVFGLIAASSSIMQYVRLSSQDAMLRAAPDTFIEGSTSGFFMSSDDWVYGHDITAYHPAYLLGAFSELLPDGSRCTTPEQANFKFFGAYCHLALGTIAIESNMMPQLLISVASNRFDANGMPLGKDGKALKRPDPPHPMGPTSFLTIRYSDASPDQPRYSDSIVRAMTAQHLADISRNGGWTTVHAGLGFRKCFASKDSTGVEITCYRG